MPAVSMTKFSVLLTMIVALGVVADAQGQGVRIGKFFRAGGGQGFHLGGPRGGIHIGEGQGTRIGGQRFGMQFGNGQGARFGNSNSGFQIGGGQGMPWVGSLPTPGDSGNPAGNQGQPIVAPPSMTPSAPPIVSLPTPASPIRPSATSVQGRPAPVTPLAISPATVVRPRPTQDRGPRNLAGVGSAATGSNAAVQQTTQADIARPSAPVQRHQKPAIESTETKSVLVRDDDRKPAESPTPTSGGKKQ